MQAILDRVAVSRVRQLLAAPTRMWQTVITVAAVATYVTTLIDLGYDATTMVTAAAVAVAAFLSGIAGFAFSAIFGAMVFQFRSDTVQVVQIMLVCSIANQTLSVWALRRDIRIRTLAPFLVGGVFGVPAGIWILLNLNAHAYATALGGVLFLYGGYMLVRKPIILQRSLMAADVAAGFLGGMLAGFAATPGAAVSMWCGMKAWDKTKQRAVLQPYILVIQLVTLAMLAIARSHGNSGVEFPWEALLCIPAGLVGTWFGLACFRFLSDRMFRTTVNLLLIISGAGLVL